MNVAVLSHGSHRLLKAIQSMGGDIDLSQLKVNFSHPSLIVIVVSFSNTLDAEVKWWSSGKERNLRALFSTLQYPSDAPSETQ
ncbi:hypothetical protein Tsubulata_026964 [Turnera subulata]|uniref:Uncharacterized protein n=1 Tax=Turnera subulata TaxID=218843 RepID=A0A9Q0GCJ9_9ROSI|nr:hypothetical protein Tsubulata_026964 [Turnera subulata]